MLSTSLVFIANVFDKSNTIAVNINIITNISNIFFFNFLSFTNWLTSINKMNANTIVIKIIIKTYVNTPVLIEIIRSCDL